VRGAHLEPNHNSLYHQLGHLSSNDLSVACVTDATIAPFFSAQSHLIELEPAHWRTQLLQHVPHFVMIESLWQGAVGLDEMRNLLQCCQENKIPTAFWNREESTQLATSFEIAALVDFVFASDLASIPVYKSILKHSRVFFLPRTANDKADGLRALTDVAVLSDELQQAVETPFAPNTRLTGPDIKKGIQKRFDYIKLELFPGKQLGMNCFKSSGTDESKMPFHRIKLAELDCNVQWRLFFGAWTEGNVCLEVRYEDGAGHAIGGQQRIAPMRMEVLSVPAIAEECTLAICVYGITQVLISEICLF